jgi:enamine deaminase RidA (YjgF/YER057c/UK114 family)
MTKIIRNHVTERMNKIVVHNNTVCLCGQVGETDTPIKDQAKGMLARVDKFLIEACSSREHMLSATVYRK